MSAALYETTLQRDALAGVVRQMWDRARDGDEIDSEAVRTWMETAGLIEEVPASAEDVERSNDDIELGDPISRLSEFGKAAMAGVAEDGQ